VVGSISRRGNYIPKRKQGVRIEHSRKGGYFSAAARSIADHFSNVVDEAPLKKGSGERGEGEREG